MASDGLFDIFKARNINSFFESFDKKLFLENLVNMCLGKIAIDNEMTVENVVSLDKNKKRRNIHDDISIVYVNFDK